jgi:hypothetical protein
MYFLETAMKKNKTGKGEREGKGVAALNITNHQGAHQCGNVSRNMTQRRS